MGSEDFSYRSQDKINDKKAKDAIVGCVIFLEELDTSGLAVAVYKHHFPSLIPPTLPPSLPASQLSLYQINKGDKSCAIIVVDLFLFFYSIFLARSRRQRERERENKPWQTQQEPMVAF